MHHAGVSSARRLGHRSASGDRRASGAVPARGGGGRRRRGPPAVCRARVPGVPAVRGVRGRRGALSVRGLRARASRPVLVQGPRVLSELRRAPDDGAGGAPGGRGAAVGAGAAVGLTVPYRLRYQMAWNHGLSRAVLGGTRWATSTHAARARGIEVGRPAWSRRCNAQGRRTELPFSHPRAGRGVHRSPGGRADVSSGAGAERRRGGGGAGDDPPPGAAAPGAPRPGAGRRRDGAGGRLAEIPCWRGSSALGQGRVAMGPRAGRGCGASGRIILKRDVARAGSRTWGHEPRQCGYRRTTGRGWSACADMSCVRRWRRSGCGCGAAAASRSS